MKQPLVSVIIPAYDAEKFIEETVRSVINQSYTNIESIIIDDGSTDNLASVVKRLIKEDERITYIKQKNKGVSSARNHGFKISNGEYIAFLDADDLWSKDRIEKMLDVLINEDESVGLVHSDMAFINSNSQLMGEVNTGLSGYVLDDLLLWDQCVIPAPSSILIKRKVILNIGLFSLELSTAADQEFFFRVASKYSIKRVEEILGYYRVHNNNMSNNVRLLETDHINAYKLASHSGLFKSSPFKRKCFSNMYLILAGNWWVDANNKRKSIIFIVKSILLYPPNVIKIIRKINLSKIF